MERTQGIDSWMGDYTAALVGIPMNSQLLDSTVDQMKSAMEAAIQSASYNGATYDDGQKAKEALIRSGTLINRLHEVVKQSISDSLTARDRLHVVHPPLGASSPELPIAGLIKAKKQDVVVLVDGDEPSPEPIDSGPLASTEDVVGLSASTRSVVVGVRSQLSSVDKNFDTLMERAFAETLNLRLRIPALVMGEVYLLPLHEYDEVLMRSNAVGFKQRPVKVEKFLKTFKAISGRGHDPEPDSLYKYERSGLVIIDFEASPARVIRSLEELQDRGAVREDSGLTELDVRELGAEGFAEDLIDIHSDRHPAREA